jgi:hypothetical protein
MVILTSGPPSLTLRRAPSSLRGCAVPGGVYALFLLLWWTTATTGKAEEDTQSWLSLSMLEYQEAALRVDGFYQIRFQRDLTHLDYFQLTQRASYRIAPWLVAAGALTHFSQWTLSEDGSDTAKIQIQRAEAEINPEFTVTDALRFRMRNRYEQRFNSSFRSESGRVRHRSTLEHPLRVASVLGHPLENIFMHGEVFFDLATHQWSQYRLVPFGANFTVSERVTLALYPMLQRLQLRGEWQQSYVVNLDLSWRP